MKRKIIYVFLILFFYKTAQFIIKHSLPGETYDDWFFADTIISIFRFLSLIATLIFLQSIDKKIQNEFHLKSGGLIMTFGLITQIPLWLKIWIDEAKPIGNPFFTIMLISNLLVGFFEEFYYRGALIEVCQEYLSPWKTIFLTSTIFMLVHFGSQPLYAFPDIFLYGFTQVLLRYTGVSLILLALNHSLFDIAFYNFKTIPNFTIYFWNGIETIVTLIFIGYMFSRTDIKGKFAGGGVKIAT